MTVSLEKLSGLPCGTGCDLPPGPPGLLSAHPGYRSTALLDQLRATEYSYLDAGGHVYLDYTGAGLPAQALAAIPPSQAAGTAKRDVSRPQAQITWLCANRNNAIASYSAAHNGGSRAHGWSRSVRRAAITRVPAAQADTGP
jgi:hypothetical protein